MMTYTLLQYTRNKIIIKSNCQHLIHFEVQLLKYYHFSLLKFCRLQSKILVVAGLGISFGRPKQFLLTIS